MSMIGIKRLFLVFSVVAATFVGAGCGAPKGAGAVAEAEAVQFDKEQVWQLVSLRGKALGKGDGEVILMLHPESGTLRGRIACNRYFADYSLRLATVKPEGTSYALRVTDVGGGDVQCPEGGMALQERYLALLAKATGCLLTPYTLTLMQKDKELMKFELQ